MAESREKDRELEINIISAARLIEGGAAILQAEKENHQNVMEGKRVIRPFVR